MGVGNSGGSASTGGGGKPSLGGGRGGGRSLDFRGRGRRETGRSLNGRETGAGTGAESSFDDGCGGTGSPLIGRGTGGGNSLVGGGTRAGNSLVDGGGTGSSLDAGCASLSTGPPMTGIAGSPLVGGDRGLFCFSIC